MKSLIFNIVIFVLCSIFIHSQSKYNKDVLIQKDEIQGEGLNNTELLYKTAFKDKKGDYKKTINGAIEVSYIDFEGALLSDGTGIKSNITIKKGGNRAVIYLPWLRPGGGGEILTRYIDNNDIFCQEELHTIIRRNWDTVWIDGTWKAESGTYEAYIAILTFQESVNDTAYYHSEELGNFPTYWQYNQSQNHDNVNRNYGIVSKTGGMLWRHDNWLGGDVALANNMGAIAQWLSVLDKYGYKATLALNEQSEEMWDGKYDKYKLFWQSIQARGHEVADHGPYHKNFSYRVSPEHRVVTENTPGVEKIVKNGKYDEVFVETTPDGLVSNAGFDLMLNRSQRLFKYIGLNPFTFWIEGGGQGIYYNPDSIFYGSYKNRSIGGTQPDGGKAIAQKYKHMGFNSPWVGKSEYFMEWRADEAISLQKKGDAVGERNYSAKEAIKKLTDQSAKHALTMFRQHVQYVKPDT
ncbi:hypothetical protein ACFLSA_00780 [Bacteroidota bacterium]